jgi:hypothetical protein
MNVHQDPFWSLWGEHGLQFTYDTTMHTTWSSYYYIHWLCFAWCARLYLAYLN